VRFAAALTLGVFGFPLRDDTFLVLSSSQPYRTVRTVLPQASALAEFHESKLVSQLRQQFLVISYHSALGALLTLLLAADRGLFSLPWFLTLERLYSGKESLGLVFCISPKRIHRIYIPPFSC